LDFNDLGLRAALVRAVRQQGYTIPTPIQARTIPAILSGRDVMAAAQTGSGKTAAFALPMLQRLMGVRLGSSRTVRALVIVPTRELAVQVTRSVRTYGAHLPLQCSVVFGGVGMQSQLESLRRGVDIVVATPGRLLDHAGKGSIDLSEVEIFVLDEADRMLDMGLIHDVRRARALMPVRRQNLLFSATFPDEVKLLSGQLLEDPELIEAGRPNSAPATIKQSMYRVDRGRKTELLTELVHRGRWPGLLVVTGTKHPANRLAQKLESSSISLDAIHGNNSQSARTRALAGFKAGRVSMP
jgi:ATP-dependent RNA helicase RhlE